MSAGVLEEAEAVTYRRPDGASGTRTRDLRAASATLSQLSYGPSSYSDASLEPRSGRDGRDVGQVVRDSGAAAAPAARA
jgi:hypothetical protein